MRVYALNRHLIFVVYIHINTIHKYTCDMNCFNSMCLKYHNALRQWHSSRFEVWIACAICHRSSCTTQCARHQYFIIGDRSKKYIAIPCGNARQRNVPTTYCLSFIVGKLHSCSGIDVQSEMAVWIRGCVGWRCVCFFFISARARWYSKLRYIFFSSNRATPCIITNQSTRI